MDFLGRMETDNRMSHFYKVLEYLQNSGTVVSPRGQECKELTGFIYSLPPRVRFMCFDHRKLRLDYVKQEFLWYLRGDKRDISIRHVAVMWDGLITQTGEINSNYGYHLFNPEAGAHGRSNFGRVAAELIKDPESRRAVICILDNIRLNSDTKDYPCTAYLNFHIRDNMLHIYVRMRSQDAIYGMGNDAPFFSFVHELMWSALTHTYPELKLGYYHHSADSFHVYARHYEMLEKIIAEPFVKVDMHDGCPLMESPDLIHELTGIAPLPRETLLASMNADVVAVFQPFTRWLIERDDTSTLCDVERRAA